MGLWRKNGDRVLLVGIFQSPDTGRAVLKNLYRARFRRVAAIHASAAGRPRVEEYGISAIGGAAAGSVFGLGIGALMFWQSGIFAGYRPELTPLFLAALALAGALSGWILVRLLRQHVDEKRQSRFAGTILPDETAVMAEVEASETARVLVILRDVEAEAPVTFGFYPPPPFSVESSHATALGGTTFNSASLGKRRASRRIDSGQPGSAAARTIVSAPAARSARRTGVGERESHHVGRNASGVRPVGGVAAG